MIVARLTDNMYLSLNDRKAYMLRHGKAAVDTHGGDDSSFAGDCDMITLESFRHAQGESVSSVWSLE